MKRMILVIGFGMLVAGFGYGTDDNAGTSVAPFLKLGASARSAGMGGVSCAISSGADGLWSNPASLAGLTGRDALFMRHQWLEEVSFNYLAGAVPLEKQGIACGINLISTGEIKRTTYSKPDGDGNFKTGGMVASAGYGREIIKQIQAGGAIKYISQSIDDKTGTGIGIDAGMLYLTSIPNLTVGAVVQNIGLTKMKFIEKEESLPVVIKAGCGYKIKNALLGIDLSKPNDNSLQFNLGGEYQITPIFAIRAGYDSSIDEGSRITAGFGITYQNLTFNGAYLGAGDLGSTFRISASMRF